MTIRTLFPALLALAAVILAIKLTSCAANLAPPDPLDEPGTTVDENPYFFSTEKEMVRNRAWSDAVAQYYENYGKESK